MSLENVPPDQVFWLEDGRSIKNLFELLKELKRSDDSIFYRHVNFSPVLFRQSISIVTS